MKQENKLQLALSIVKLSPKYKKVGNVIILSIIISLLLVIFNCLIHSCQSLCILSFIFLGFAVLSSLLHSFFQKEVINIGSLILCKQGIIINGEMISLENIVLIQLSVNSVKGESIGYFATETGVDNIIEINDRGSNVYIYNILFEERAEIFRTRLILKHYMDKGIKVKKVVSI